MTSTSFGDQLHQMWQTRPARLPRRGPIAGVAAGVGHRYDIDPVLVRVAFVVSTLFGGAGIVLYLFGWLMFSEGGRNPSLAESLTQRRQDSSNQTKTIVLIVALAIAVSTMGPVGVGLGGSGVIAMALMLAGWWMLHLRTPEPPPLPPDASAAEPPAAPGTTGYPGATFPHAGVDPYTSHPTGMYTPYTKLPDRYVPESPASEAKEPETAATEHAGRGPDLTKRPTAESPEWAAGSVARAPTGEQATSAAGSTTEEPHSASTPGTTEKPDSTPTADATTKPGSASASGAGAPSASGATSASTATPGSASSTPADRTGAPLPHSPLGAETASGRTPPAWDPLGVAPLAWDLPDPTPARPVAVRTEKPPRSRFTPIVLGLALLATAGAGALAVSGSEWMTPVRIGAVALAVIGAGLMLGAFRHRGQGLLLATVPLAAFVVLAAAIGPVDMQQATFGERTWAPTSAADIRPEYAVTMGSGVLDLRGIELTSDRTIDLSVQMGEAVVWVPDTMTVRTDCTVRMGEANCPDGLTGPGGDAPVLTLNVQVRMGEAVVQRG